MIKTSYLRVYQPAADLSPEERDRLPSKETEPGPATESGATVVQSTTRQWLIGRRLPDAGEVLNSTDGVFTRTVDGVLLVCPWRTQLRMLAGLLAFRATMPEEVVDAFVPEEQARSASRELEQIAERDPGIRSHILQASWHVPLRWFVAFEDAERVLTEDAGGLRVRYETPLTTAIARLARALEVLEASAMDEAITEAVKELLDWLADFPSEGLLELDYGSVADLFEPDELVDDRSSAEVWGCLSALEKGDVMAAGRSFGTLSERWAERRAHEVMN